jgi:hypothetical protein
MGNYWNALETASGQHITFTNRDYNDTVPPDGGTVSFGFIVTGAFSPPVNCMINGSPCGGSGAGASPSASPSPSSQPTPSPTTANPSPTPTPSPSATQPPGGESGAGAFAVAPYVDMTNNQEGMLDQAAAAGLKAFIASFVTGSGCTPIWGDGLPVTNDPNVTGEITHAEGEGASPMVSFGGDNGAELAQSCTNLNQLVAAYQSVINTLHLTHIDFDIEGAAVADTASNNLRFQAIKALQAANPGLVVSLSIPVIPSGPDSNGQAFLTLMHSDGVTPNVVNIQAIDYGSFFDTGGANMAAEAISAAQDTLSFLKTLIPSATYSMIGVTTMIGENDDSAEVFTEADAQTLVSFAQQNHLGLLSFWSVDRDQPCGGSVNSLPQCSMISQQPLDFTKIFDTFTG